jgi:4-aminobutyrate aminotransferase/(S)-3-amino-2-methylpropionate transaminase
MAMSLTAKVMPYKHRFGPFAPEIYRLPYAYPYRCPAGQPPESCGPACVAHAIGQMEDHIGADSIAAIVIEPVQGEGGFIVPAPEFLPALKEFCEDHGILFVADEVQTGFGRTGKWFAVEHAGIVPDLVTTAKAMGGGFPLGAITGRKELMDTIHVGGLGGTFGGNPVACAAALAAIDQIEREDLAERAGRIGETITARFLEFKERFELVGDVRGLGAMVAMELVTDRDTKAPAKEAAARIIEDSYKQGAVVLKAGTYDNVIRLLPPLTIDEELLDEGLGILEKALASAAG